MNTFSFKRFWLTLSTSIVSEKKRYMRYVLTFYITLTAFYLVINLNVLTGARMAPVNYGALCGIFYFGLMLVMLPASRLEKFITLVIDCVVMTLLCYLAGALLADITQFLLFSLFRPSESTFIVSELFKLSQFSTTVDGNVSTFTMASFALLMSVWGMSIFLLGGVFFRRYAWLLTAATLHFAFIILISIASNFSSFNFDLNEASAAWLFNCANIVITLLIILNVVLAYWMYRRLQVINNKWINY